MRHAGAVTAVISNVTSPFGSTFVNESESGTTGTMFSFFKISSSSPLRERSAASLQRKLSPASLMTRSRGTCPFRNPGTATCFPASRIALSYSVSMIFAGSTPFSRTSACGRSSFSTVIAIGGHRTRYAAKREAYNTKREAHNVYASRFVLLGERLLRLEFRIKIGRCLIEGGEIGRVHVRL